MVCKRETNKAAITKLLGTWAWQTSPQICSTLPGDEVPSQMYSTE